MVDDDCLQQAVQRDSFFKDFLGKSSPYHYCQQSIYYQQSTNSRTRQSTTTPNTSWHTSTTHGLQARYRPYHQGVFHTNNDVEGGHHRLNKKTKKEKLQFYLILALLYQEARQLPGQIKMVYESKLYR
ncbi:hypothetical protein ScPMuIL_005026 [Solemya velum]